MDMNKVKKGSKIVKKYAPKYLSPRNLFLACQRCVVSRDKMIEFLREHHIPKEFFENGETE